MDDWAFKGPNVGGGQSIISNGLIRIGYVSEPQVQRVMIEE